MITDRLSFKLYGIDVQSVCNQTNWFDILKLS